MPRRISSTVLLIEPDIFLRRLIVLGLERQGMRVIAVNSLAALADQPIENPDLLVLDIDNGSRDDAALLAAVETHPYLSLLPLVVLAWDQILPITSCSSLPLRECLSKPFDARALHATIENLLETSAAIEPRARCEVAPSSAGFSPLVTASGLLLTVIGLMLQPMVAGAGLLVVLIGLLWWTLGRRPEPQILLGEVGKRYSPSLP